MNRRISELDDAMFWRYHAEFIADAQRRIDAGRRGCPDGGVCHHECADGGCVRVRIAGPLSGVFPDDFWPDRIKETQT